MATTTNSIHRSTVTLLLPKKVPALIVYAQGIVKRMTANASFPNPTPALAVVTAAIDALRTAETAALARTKGAAAARNEKRAALVTLLQQVRAHIQATADADPTSGASVIQGAGVAVRKTATLRARTFAAKPGPVSRGDARLLVGRQARVVRMAVQHRRRQDLGHGADDPEGQDEGLGPATRGDGALQVPGGDQDRRGGLEPAGVARGFVSPGQARRYAP